MRDKLISRLEQLKREFQSGRTKLQDLEIQQTRLRETLLRISGAIQVLEEILEVAKSDESPRAQEISPAESAPGKADCCDLKNYDFRALPAAVR
jgi:predicted nuclease with TOPRIM domain